MGEKERGGTFIIMSSVTLALLVLKSQGEQLKKHSDTPHIQGSANKPYLSCKNVAAIQAELGSMSREEGTQFEKTWEHQFCRAL